MTDAVLAKLQATFGFDSFRPLQRQAIDAAVTGQDALVVLPTGAGKSLCYQIPALLSDNLTLVVSPLVALMQDQVDALRRSGVAAAFINSTLSASERDAAWQSAALGELRLLYLAPEQLALKVTQSRLQAIGIGLIAIDEAHCVSQWGHDFRPDYRALGQVAEQFPEATRIALTATATQETRDDIVAQLRLREPTVIVGDFDRPNIRYAVQPKLNARQQLSSFLESRRGQNGIIYCLSRKKVEATAEWLVEQGWQAAAYHAGLPSEHRSAAQRAFLSGDIAIVVATIAFGMGIDKPDVRFVVHVDLPKSMEAYYQETGRAGRDGEPADAWMLYGTQDVFRLRQMLQSDTSTASHNRAQQQRLDALLGWCESVTCRRGPLLRYFDDEDHADCQNCDNCELPPPIWDATNAARQLLSAIYRTEQRFGAAYVIDVLLGNVSDRIRDFGHDQLSVFGIGKDHGAQEWRSLIRQLVAADMLTVDPDFGGLRLQEKCRALLRGEASFQARKDTVAKSRGGTRARVRPQLTDPAEEHLFEVLKSVRLDIARDEGIPPYRIFHDATLMEMVRRMPDDPTKLLEITGVGEAKLERYGEDFLSALSEHTAHGH